MVTDFAGGPPYAVPSTAAHAWTNPGPGLWSGRVGSEVRARDEELLSESERWRFRRLRGADERAWYVGGRAAVRRVVAGELGVEPAAVRWGRAACPGCGSDRHGPPRIDEPPTDRALSVSRSGDRWMLALVPGTPVGVDVELRRPQRLDGVLRSALGERERDYVLSFGGPRRDDALLRCWVRKEAVVKGWGIGLGTNLAAVDVTPGEETAVVSRTTREGGREPWEVREVAVGDDCFAAVAHRVARAAA